MDGNDWYCWKRLEILTKLWKQLEMASVAGKGWKYLKIAGNNLIWLEMAQMVGNGWT